MLAVNSTWVNIVFPLQTSELDGGDSYVIVEYRSDCDSKSTTKSLATSHILPELLPNPIEVLNQDFPTIVSPF